MTRPPRPAAHDPGFLAKIEEVVPNDESPRRSEQGFFLPPNQRNAFITGREYLLRYERRFFQAVTQDDPVRQQVMETYSAATVFSQATGTDHLLTVPLDARTVNVSDLTYDWMNLSFEYQRLPNSARTLASLVSAGSEEHLPASAPAAWEKLIPRPYRYRRTDDQSGNPIPSETTFAGLIGRLDFLIALAAFSACRNGLIDTLTTLRSPTGSWVAHDYNSGCQSRPNICPPPPLESTKLFIRYPQPWTGHHYISRP